MEFNVWTDGSTLKNPGPGGFAWLAKPIGDSTKAYYGSGTAAATTSNRMEMQAVIDCLETLLTAHSGDLQATIHSDSEYLVKGFSDRLKKWKGNGWKTAAGPVKNQDLWEKLSNTSKLIKCSFVWIKGHSGIEENEFVDKLAYKAVKEVYGLQKNSRGR